MARNIEERMLGLVGTMNGNIAEVKELYESLLDVHAVLSMEVVELRKRVEILELKPNRTTDASGQPPITVSRA